jgi:quercetin dioxygenase-like cupin family protein
VTGTHRRAFEGLTALAVVATPSLAVAQQPPAAVEVDALVASPENFRLILENDQVRVLEYTLLPGHTDRPHTHPQRVSHYLSAGTLRVRYIGGTSQVFEQHAGETAWSGPSPLHDTQNIGATPIQTLLVEVKRRGVPSYAPRP